MGENRRDFLKILGAGAAVATTAGHAASPPPPASDRPKREFPERILPGGAALARGATLEFAYPDADSPCILIRSQAPVIGGVGPDSDFIAFSRLCPHMGCALRFDAHQNVFKCPCHFSRYDAEKRGQMIIGQATRNLATIELRFDAARKTLSAVGIDGLVWGRRANIID